MSAVEERAAQMIAHRACCGVEHDPQNGKLHGYCVVCGVPWPCEYAGPKPSHAKQLDAANAEIERLERLVYVPGVWVCAKCKLPLVSTILDAGSGRFAANKEPQQCPNGCGPMWRKTERDAGNELCKRLEDASDANERLRAELASARNDALLNEQDAVRWRKFISFDCLALHLPILRANSIETRNSTADAMDRLIDAIDCEPVIRTLSQKEIKRGN